MMELTSCQTQVRSRQRPDCSLSTDRLSGSGFCLRQTNMTTAQISVTDGPCLGHSQVAVVSYPHFLTYLLQNIQVSLPRPWIRLGKSA